MQETGSENTSGQGAAAVVPEEIKGWNWSAFLLGPIWAIGHQVWIGLLGFVPYVGFIMCIVLGIKGGEWAWQNRKFESIDQYKQIQKIWLKWGIVVLILSVVIGIIFGIISAVIVSHSSTYN